LGSTPAAIRVMRFDFHWTTTGWHISEVNSDVPGGYCESSSFTRLIAAEFPALHHAGDPAQTWVDAMARLQSGPIALLCAPGFMEDQQVVSYLAQRLRKHGCDAILAEPRQLRWYKGHAHLNGTRLGAIVRFYQAEWLCRLPRRCGWTNFVAGGKTPVTNPGAAILSESKRFPLVWDHLPFDPSAWRRLLPETRDPREAPWQDDDSWLIKSAYCNTGDTVTIRRMADAKRWRSAARAARWHPGQWLAQKRFETVPLSSPIGRIYPCIGIYVIDGVAAGAYARVSPTPVIDYSATDVALLLNPEAADE
jgi:glutathionylspermidine synthase